MFTRNTKKNVPQPHINCFHTKRPGGCTVGFPDAHHGDKKQSGVIKRVNFTASVDSGPNFQGLITAIAFVEANV